MRLLYVCAFVAAFSTYSAAQLPYVTTTYLDDYNSETRVLAVKKVGDVNADGTTDYAISLSHSNVAPGAITGEVTVYSGSDNSIIHHFDTVLMNQFLGETVAAGGDINNDGFDDILVSAKYGPSAQVAPGPGEVRAYSGADGTIIHTVLGLANDAAFGKSIASMGDINGDGFADYVAGAPRFHNASFTQTGYIQLVSGIDGSAILTIFGPFGSDSGQSVDNVGDIDGDGIDDFGVADPGFAFPGAFQTGRVRIRSGATGLTIHTIFGTLAVPGGARWSVRGVGDLDGDGVPDFAIGQPAYVDPSTNLLGRVEIYSGATGTPFRSILGSTTAVVANSSIFGVNFESIPDLDGDGVNEIISPNGTAPFSRAFVYSGATTSIIKSFPAPRNGYTFNAWPIGDQNGDGMDEIAVYCSTELSAVGGAITGIEVRIYTSGTKPIEPYTSNSGMPHALSLGWIPDVGSLHSPVGDLRSAGASPGALGVVLVSLAPADIPIFGTDLLVAVDSVNLSVIATLGADASGVFNIPNITRRIPALAGTSTYVQVYETSPAVRASRAIRFTVIP